MYTVSVNKPYLSNQVYITNSQIQNGDPIYELKNGDWVRREGFKEWCDESNHFIDIETLRTYPTVWPWRENQTRNNTRYLVWARLMIRRKGSDGLDVELIWHRATPEYQSHDEGMQYVAEGAGNMLIVLRRQIPTTPAGPACSRSERYSPHCNTSVVCSAKWIIVPHCW